jgi:hypothetical protein
MCPFRPVNFSNKLYSYSNHTVIRSIDFMCFNVFCWIVCTRLLSLWYASRDEYFGTYVSSLPPISTTWLNQLSTGCYDSCRSVISPCFLSNGSQHNSLMFFARLTFFIHITPVATRQFSIYDMPKCGDDSVINKLNLLLCDSRFVRMALAIMPPIEKPIMLIDWMYGFFYRYLLIYYAPFLPSVSMSWFFSLLSVYSGRKLIVVKVLIKDLILAMSR